MTWGSAFVIAREAGAGSRTKLSAYANRPDVLVLALPRGGVPVAYEVARALGAPLDVFLVRKLGVPGHEELAMGAIATGGVRVLNDQVVRRPAHPGLRDRRGRRTRSSRSWRGASASTAATGRRPTCAAAP